MRKVSLCLVVFIACCLSHRAPAATHTAASCSLADVQAAVNAAQNGDTVLIPNGSATWTGGIATTKQIMIRAQNYVATPNGNVARNVVITNNSLAPLFDLTSGSSFHCGLAGIKFLEGTQQTNYIRVQGSGSKVPLVSDCWFDVDERFGNQPDVAPFAWLSLGGVIWNCRFDTPGLDFQGYPGSHGSTIYIHSPRAWNTPSTMGALDTNGNVNTYFENCTFFNCGQCPDTDDNGRVVFRHCLFDGTTGITHGFTSTWGGRHFEYYDSTFSVTTPERNCNRYFWVRAGTGLFTDCVVNNSVTPGAFGNCTLLDIGDNTAPTGYPQARQPGWGHNGTTNVIDPIYIWNNTGARAYTWGHNTQGGSWDQMVLLNREIFVNSGAKPGYAKFAYPHPFRSGTTQPPPADTTFPTVAMTAPTGGATVSGTVTVSANASDNVGVTSVQFRLDGANLGAADTASPFSISWNTTSASNGSHTLSAVARDAAGNSTTSASVSVTVSNASSGPAPLPTGNNGIAAQYPDDTNIKSNAAVIYADGFEGYTTANDLWSNWSNVFQVSNTRIATEAGNYFGGNKALEFKLPQGSTEVANAVQRNLNPTEDLVFIRYYTKFDPTFDITGSGHNGASLQARYDGPGVPANGTNKFLVMTENSRESTSVTSPGPTHIYIYHPEQRDIWGDHWYPDGTISPFTSTPGNFGPYFVSRPNTTPQLGRWYCYELMVKANTPGQRDGRIAIWIDGTLVADWLNVRLRDVSTLKMDKFDLGLHAHNRSHDIKKWYDNVVVARSYIGPVVSSTTPPLPTVTVAATDAAAGEPSNPGLFTFTRNGATTAALTVNYSVGGTAGSADYAALGTSVTIPAGAASATRTVTPVDDTIVEPNETAILTIASNAAYIVGTPSSATVTIADNDAAPPSSITISPSSITFTGQAGGPRPAAKVVTVNVSNGAAWTSQDTSPFFDASPTSGAAGGSQTLTPSAGWDALAPGTYTQSITYSAAGNADLVVQVTAVKTSVTTPTVTVAATDAAAGEPSNPGVFTFTRTGATTAALTVNFAVGGTATSGTDYTALGTSVTIPAGAASATRTVTPVDNTVVESNETVILTIAANAAYTVGSPSSATVTIADNDTPPPPLPTVTIAATDAAAGEPSNPGVCTFTRTGATTAALTVNYSVGGTATSVSDYNTLGTSVTIPAGAASATRTVTPVDNTVVEPNETVIVTISSNAAYTVGSPASATVTIADNDTPPNTVPVITSAASATPNPALAGQNVSFSVAASDENGDALTYSWTFGDGASATGSSAAHAYAAAGTYTAKATANDGHGGTVSSSVTVSVVAASGIVVDNKNANTSRTGTWATSAGVNPWAGQSLFSNGGGTFRWTPAVAAAGQYQVFAWWTYHSNRSTNVPYKIAHAAGTATVSVNQRLAAAGGRWNLLGTFSFNAGSAGFVEVSSVNGQACADAIRLVPVSAAAAALEGSESVAALDAGAGAADAAAVAPGELTVNALKVSVNFAKDSGAVRLTSTLQLPEDFNPAGVAVTVDVCGASASVTLDKRGRAKSANGTVALKRSRSGWTVSASLKNLVWPNQWTEAGVEDWKTYSGKVAMPVVVTVGDAVFIGEREITCKGKGKRTP